MSNNRKNLQPRWPLAIIKALCVPEYAEEIEGDLEEAFEARMQDHPFWLGMVLYMWDVLSFLRPSLLNLNRRNQQVNVIDMLQNHFKIAIRVFSSSKLFTTINIAGLTIGITAFLLILNYVRFESRYDQQHPYADDLYRVTLSNDGGNTAIAANHPAVAAAMKREFPEVENFARMVDKKIIFGSFVLSYTNNQGEVVRNNANDYKMYVAEASLLELFEIAMVHGEASTALEAPNSLIISQRVAKQFFGEEDPLNKTFYVNNEHPVIVRGVFEDLPENTHLEFDLLVSFTTLGEWVDNTWVWPEFYNYVRLHPATDPSQVEAKFPQLIRKHMSEIMDEHGFETTFALQKVSDIHLKSQLGKEISANSSDEILYFLLVVAGFVIGIALINFINLSTAKSIERAKEVGLKKVVGAPRSSLITQFLLESLMINFLSVLLSILLLVLLMDPFNELVGLNVLSMDLLTQPWTWFVLLSVFFTGGILAGVYPAFILSGFKPVQVLKGKYQQSSSGTMLRKALVVVQFSISLMLIAGTFIVYSQFSFMQNQEVGYDKEHTVVINAPMVVDSTINNQLSVFKDELIRYQEIHNISMTNDIPGKRIDWLNGVRRMNVTKEDGNQCYLMSVDHDFLPTYEMELLAGRNFKPEDITSYNNNEENPIHPVIINRTLAKELGFNDVHDALNERIIFILGPKDRRSVIIGIVEDYHQQSLRLDYEPILFFYPNYYNSMYMTINVQMDNVQETRRSSKMSMPGSFPMIRLTSSFWTIIFTDNTRRISGLGKSVCCSLLWPLPLLPWVYLGLVLIWPSKK